MARQEKMALFKTTGIITVMKLYPSQALYVGNDTYQDVFGAQRVYVRTILANSNQEAKSSENITPDFFATRFEQVLKGVLTSWVLEITRWNH
jgi:putative hydrolase of the HAD superfamily